MLETSQPNYNKKNEEVGSIRPNKLFQFIEKAKEFLRIQRDFSVNKRRAHEYYAKERDYEFHPDLIIPLGSRDTMHYKGHERGGHNDRDLSLYMTVLFPDDFRFADIRQIVTEYRQTRGLPEQWTAEEWSETFLQSSIPKKEGHESLFGGYDEAVAPGKVVLDLGSGQALGLMEMAEKYPHTTFIGVDKLYQDKRRIYPTIAGLQLTQGDWTTLDNIPSNSIDTILSLQGFGIWGLERYKEENELKDFTLDTVSSQIVNWKEEDQTALSSDMNDYNNNLDPEPDPDAKLFDADLVAQTFTTFARVLKKGGTVRFDVTQVYLIEELISKMDPQIWNTRIYNENLIIAEKIA